MPQLGFSELLQAAGIPPQQLDPALHLEILSLLEQAQSDPQSSVIEILRTRHERDHVKVQCAKAADAAAELDAMLQKLLQPGGLFCRLETVCETLDGPRAVCRINGSIRDLPIHPEVDVAQLRGLKSWEYVRVQEDVVVSMWKDDPQLFTAALGDTVQFKAYQDAARHLVCVADGPGEKVVKLDDSLCHNTLTAHSKLVLQRDDQYRAISLAHSEQTRSRFEVDINTIHTRLEDLAGVEELAERVIEDILLRIYYPEIRKQYGFETLKGILLYSYKPGMGKTRFMGGIALWLHEHSDVLGFDVCLYVVKPNETKSMWHGEDARIVREDLWGAIRARAAAPRTRPLIQIVVIDEIDSLGKRAGGGEPVYSAAQSDALEALLVEMDGLIQDPEQSAFPSYVLCAAMTNRPDRVDDALKRPGRFDLVLAVPNVDIDGAEDVMAIYTRNAQLPWYVAGSIQQSLDEQEIRRHFLRPALARVFSTVILRYKTDTQQRIDCTAGQVLANAHYKDAMNRAKKRAAIRQLRNVGIPAVTPDDVVGALVDVACEAASQMEADPHMLVRQLEIKVPVAGVEIVPREEYGEHRFLRVP